MKKARIISNYYFRQIMLSRFAKSTYEESKKDRSLDTDVPIGEMVLGVNYSKDDFNKKRDEIRRQLDVDTIIAHQSDIYLMVGDEEIINAWSNCMKDQGGGLSLRYAVQNRSTIFAYLEWFTPANVAVNELTLSKDVPIPPGINQKASDLSCLKKGSKIPAGGRCTSTIYLTNGRTPLILVVKAENKAGRVADVSAYLSPRIK